MRFCAGTSPETIAYAKELLSLPFHVRPDRVEYFYPAFNPDQPGYSLYPTMGFELFHPDFDPNSPDLGEELIIYFGYEVDLDTEGPLAPRKWEWQRELMYHQGPDGQILVDRLKDL